MAPRRPSLPWDSADALSTAHDPASPRSARADTLQVLIPHSPIADPSLEPVQDSSAMAPTIARDLRRGPSPITECHITAITTMAITRTEPMHRTTPKIIPVKISTMVDHRRDMCPALPNPAFKLKSTQRLPKKCPGHQP